MGQSGRGQSQVRTDHRAQMNLDILSHPYATRLGTSRSAAVARMFMTVCWHVLFVFILQSAHVGITQLHFEESPVAKEELRNDMHFALTLLSPSRRSQA